MLDQHWYSHVEPIMDWWINNTPLWMQPKWVWSVYFYCLDRF